MQAYPLLFLERTAIEKKVDGGAEYMPEDEVKVAAAERLRISMERIALLKAAQPRPKSKNPQLQYKPDIDKLIRKLRAEVHEEREKSIAAK